jgi:hypothetical protein
LGVGSEEYTAKFSQYTLNDVAPEKIAEHFAKVKADIMAGTKSAKLPVEAAKPEAVVKEKAPKTVEVALKEKAPTKVKGEKSAELTPAKEKAVAKATKGKPPKEAKEKAVKAEAPKAKEAKPKAERKVTKKVERKHE